ncbi:hypothetical protein [Stenotrophomonas indicatrix]|uniref:hypothetical protein n=1 Tax=Stenotrophomonas indicatrix TaxID=2045451 RepID=UPI0020041595|nr:hypothetical protein [Stenotrophomonas indicatrix]
MQTLVMVPAMISWLRPVAFTAATNSGVVPGVDLAASRYVLRMRCGVMDLRDQRAVRPLRYRRGGDHRHLRQGGHFRQRGGVRAY